MMKKTKILIGLLTLSVILTGCNSKTEKITVMRLIQKLQL